MIEATMSSELLDEELELSMVDGSALFNPLIEERSDGDGRVSGPGNS